MRLIGTGFMLATTLAAFAAFAQEAPDDLLPAVDTSAALAESAPAEDAGSDEFVEAPAGFGEASGAEADEAVPEAVLAADVTRSASAGGVMDSMTLGRTEITGNQELPKVLYIVPWKKADPGDLMGRPVNTLLDEVLAPLDREEFVRQVEYYDDLYGSK